MRSWVRLHDELVYSPKLLLATGAGVRELFLLPRLIVWAGLIDDRGRLSNVRSPLLAALIASALPGATAERVQVCIDSCLSLGILKLDDDGVPVFANWKRRQGGWKEKARAGTSRARTARWRAKKKEASAVSGANTTTVHVSAPTTAGAV